LGEETALVVDYCAALVIPLRHRYSGEGVLLCGATLLSHLPFSPADWCHYCSLLDMKRGSLKI
jgi:hypothetical protein